jgi:hypothetical protein
MKREKKQELIEKLTEKLEKIAFAETDDVKINQQLIAIKELIDLHDLKGIAKSQSQCSIMPSYPPLNRDDRDDHPEREVVVLNRQQRRQMAKNTCTRE